MTTPSQLIECLDFIETKLKGIADNSSSLTTPQVKRGWLQHLFVDHTRHPIDFPVIAYRPEISDTKQSQDNQVAQDTVILVLDGAVLVKETETPVDDLINMLKDIRVALAIDPSTHKLPFSNMVFGACAFDLPEAGEPYAFFSQKLTLNIIEELC